MFGEVLKQLRREKDITQGELAKAINASKSKVSMWETNARDPVKDDLIVLSNYFGVSIDELLNTKFKPAPRSYKIPVFSSVSAGNPLIANEDIIDYEEVPITWQTQGEFFGLRIEGKSMEPRFCDGDVVIVKKQSDVDDGDMAIVLVNGDEATFKIVKKSPSGITLVATNPSVYLPHYYSNRDIQSLPVIIVGKVIEARIKI